MQNSIKYDGIESDDSDVEIYDMDFKNFNYDASSFYEEMFMPGTLYDLCIVY